MSSGITEPPTESVEVSGQKTLTALLDQIEHLANDPRVPKGPWIVKNDDAEECGPHAHSGLALIVAPKDESKIPWPPARLLEWPTGEFIAMARSDLPRFIKAQREARTRYYDSVGGESNLMDVYDNAIAQLLREPADSVGQAQRGSITPPVSPNPDSLS